MVIHYLHIVSISVTPDKADAPLIVDPNAVLASSIAFQGFQTIARRGREVAKLRSNVQLPKLALRHPLESPEPFDALPGVKLFRLLRAEGLNHLGRV